MSTPEPPGVLDGLTPEERIEEFLRLLGSGCTVRAAAAACALDWSALYRRRKNDPEFAKAWEDAQRVSVKHLIAEAERRAMNGSDKLLMFLLQSYDAKFNPKQTIEHQGGIALQVITGVPDSDVDDML